MPHQCLNDRSPKIVHLGEIARALSVTPVVLIDGLGYTGEPIIVTGAGNAGVGRPEQKQKRG